MSITIRPITKNEVKSLVTLSRQTFKETFIKYNTAENVTEYLNQNLTPEILVQELANSNSWFYFILVEGEIAGYLKLNQLAAQTEKMIPNAIEIQRIYVLRKFQRQGLGSKLMDYAIEQAEILQKKRLWLGVWEKNIPALTFYRKNGFQVENEHVFHIGHASQRDFIMVKELNTK